MTRCVGTRPTSLAQKLRSRRWLVRTVPRLKRRRLRVVLTNGCFDLLHVGHVTLLERAKRLGDLLIVALNSDQSARRLKGAGRPIVPQRDRAMLLAALGCVDYVTIFDEPTPREVIAALKPDVLVKGSDWTSAEIVGGGLVKRGGGRVVRIPFVDGYSTTQLLERIVRLSARRTKARGSP